MPCRVVLVFLAIASLPLRPVEAQAQAGRPPWFGTWQLVPEPAGRFESPAYKKVTIRIEPWEERRQGVPGDSEERRQGVPGDREQGIRVTYELVKARGGIEHREWTGRFDGRDYAVQGLDYFLTNAYRVIDDHSYEITIKRDGRAVATARAVVSPDGESLTVTTSENDAKGRPVTTTAVYRRLQPD